jgi:hypothetical protein
MRFPSVFCPGLTVSVDDFTASSTFVFENTVLRRIFGPKRDEATVE